MKKVIKNVVIIVYAIIAIFVTICLLSYNKFKTTQFGKTSLVIIDNTDLEPSYKKGELAIVTNSNKIYKDDEIFYYNSYAGNITISVAKVTNIESFTDSQSTYTLESGIVVSSDHVIGKTDTTKKIPVIGNILSVLESKWGYLFIIVLPALLAFLYEIYEFVMQVKKSKKSDKE